MSAGTPQDSAGAAFFGFMGVSLALVLASKAIEIKISEQHTELLKQEQESAASQYGDQELL